MTRSLNQRIRHPLLSPVECAILGNMRYAALLILLSACVTESERARAAEQQRFAAQHDHGQKQAALRNAQHDRATTRREQNDADEARARAQARVAAVTRREQLAHDRATSEAYRHSEAGLEARACSTQNELADFTTQLAREKKISEESGIVNRARMYSLVASKQACEDELAAVGKEYRTLTGRDLPACP